MGNSFIELFEGMSVSAFMCLSLGLMLVIVEFFQTTNRFAAICGSVLIVAGTVIRMLADGSVGILFWITFSVAVILLVAHSVMLFTQKRNWLVHSLTLALDESPVMMRGAGYSYLKNLTGVATTDINLTGHVSINDVNFFVSSKTPIEKGSLVRVLDVDDENVFVERLLSVGEDTIE